MFLIYLQVSSLSRYFYLLNLQIRVDYTNFTLKIYCRILSINQKLNGNQKSYIQNMNNQSLLSQNQRYFRIKFPFQNIENGKIIQMKFTVFLCGNENEQIILHSFKTFRIELCMELFLLNLLDQFHAFISFLVIYTFFTIY